MDLPGESATQSEAQAQGDRIIHKWTGQYNTAFWLDASNELWVAAPQDRSLGVVHHEITREMYQLALSYERVKFLEKALSEMWTEFGNDDYDEEAYPNLTEWLKEPK